MFKYGFSTYRFALRFEEFDIKYPPQWDPNPWILPLSLGILKGSKRASLLDENCLAYELREKCTLLATLLTYKCKQSLYEKLLEGFSET